MNKPSYSSEWTQKLGSRMLWNFYWMQQKIMEPYLSKSHHLVELGVGSGFCANYLRSQGYAITTIDIDPDKHPDIICDASDWIPDKDYDGFLAFQVFEHMPFDIFSATIANCAKAQIRYLFVSVPDNRMSKKIVIRMQGYLAKWGNIDLDWRWPFWKAVPIKTKTHMWELDDGNISRKMYYDVFKKCGYEVVTSDRMSYAQYNVFKLA